MAENFTCATCGIDPEKFAKVDTVIKDNSIAENNEEVDYILYSTNCPKCIILEKKMTSKKLIFKVSNDIDVIIAEGFREAPVLYVVATKEYMNFSDANKFVNLIPTL